MDNFIKMVEEDFSGCILVEKDNETLFKKSFGYTDLPNKISNEIDTKFATASAGKAFVAVGVLQLIERGKLKLTDKIGDILEFDLKEINKDITIKQLLTHTSGIPDYFDESVMDEYAELWKDYPNYKIRSSSDLIPLFIDKPMLYSPGEKFQYNNTGFVVLGLIIEKISRNSFDQFLYDNIFKPANMLDTGYYELDRLPAKCANSYIYDNKSEQYYTNIYSVDVKGTGAGGAFTTVLDVKKFWNSLLNGHFISHDMLNQMLTPQSEVNYGYGIWLKEANDNTYIPYFQGHDPGVSFVSYYVMEKNLSITIVSNFGCNVWKIGTEILRELEVIQ